MRFVLTVISHLSSLLLHSVVEFVAGETGDKPTFCAKVLKKVAIEVFFCVKKLTTVDSETGKMKKITGVAMGGDV